MWFRVKIKFFEIILFHLMIELEPPPSVDRPKIILFNAWFCHEMK